VAKAARNPLGSEVQGTSLRMGQRVHHAKFGEGVVINHEGEGKQARVQVNFRQEGSKWLMVAYADLQPLGRSG
jgi:DNA helicase II / ATP-dependent DNA helicase PcrA